MRIRPHKDDSSENNIFWVTMTDLMTALVLVFIVLFFYTYMTSYYEKIQGKMEQSRASEALEQALKEQNIEANIDTSGVVKISDLELFDVNRLIRAFIKFKRHKAVFIILCAKSSNYRNH